MSGNETTLPVEAWAAYCQACDWVSERTFASQTAALHEADRHQRWCRKRQSLRARGSATPGHGHHCWDGDELVCGWPEYHDDLEYQEALMG